MKRPPQMVVLWTLAALFVAGCYWAAARADAWLVQGPEIDPGPGTLLVEGDALLECLPEGTNRAGPVAEGVRLYANVELAFSATTGEGSSTSLFVVARGRPLRGVWPMLRFHVDRAYLGAFFVASREWRVYRMDVDLDPGRHHFSLAYVNDRPGFPAKRDVDLRLIGVGDVDELNGSHPGLEGSVVKAGALHFDTNPAGSLEEDDPLNLTPCRHVVTLDEFDLDTGAGIHDGARVLWSNGSLGRTIVAPEDGAWRLSVKARGEVCGGRGPLTLVPLDEDHVATWEVGDDGYRDHVARLSLTAGRHEIRLVFDNDHRIPGLCDRNLHVAGLRLEPDGS